MTILMTIRGGLRHLQSPNTAATVASRLGNSFCKRNLTILPVLHSLNDDSLCYSNSILLPIIIDKHQTRPSSHTAMKPAIYSTRHPEVTRFVESSTTNLANDYGLVVTQKPY